MNGGGWTLYDNFSSINITAGSSTTAYNHSSISLLSDLTNTGYEYRLTSVNSSNYETPAGYRQMFYGRETEGYIQRTMPAWAKAVRVDASKEWCSGYNTFTHGNQNFIKGPYEGRTSNVFNGGGQTLKLLENASSIMWIDAVWVK